jgi:NitT/TauT family transport system ATP-binding protein
MPEPARLVSVAASRLERGVALELVGVSKVYRTFAKSQIVALSPTTVALGEGEFVSIVGPSGCGKTTLLNMIAGLIAPSDGEIRFRGARLSGPSREIGVVFQRPVLLPWLRVIDNVLLPVDVIGLKPRAAYVDKARELLSMVGLAGFENVYPRELSGGMQQRAAIARALVYETRVLLMDEPFAALDAMTREELNLELLRIWQLTGKTIVFVTHNIPEAVLLSDRIVVMTPRPGQIRKIVPVDLGRPRSLSLMGNPRFGEIADAIRAMFRPRGESRG